MRDPVVMNHSGIPGQENVTVERAAYRLVWYPLGWRSDDDPNFTGDLTVRTTVDRLQPGKGAVCFVWDDGWDTQPAAAAMFTARGQRATFAITTGLVGTASHLSAAQVRSLAAQGHEIAAHGIQHVTGLPGLTAAQRATEYTTCLDWFEPNGIARPTTWVYTFGGVTGRSDDTDRELWGRVDRVMDTGSVPPATIGVHRDFPQFVARRLHIESDVAQSLDSGRLLIEQAAQYPVVTSFYLHQFNNGAANTLTAAELADLLDLCDELDVPVITAAEALPKHDPLVHGGFEQDPSGWVYTASGGVGEIVTDTPVVGLPGSRSLHLSAGAGQFVYARHPVLVKPGTSYTLSGRYRTSAGLGGATAKVRINQLNYKGGSVTQATTPLAESTSWARFSVATTLDAATTHVDVDCLFQPGVAGEAWYDHLCFLPTSAGAYG